MTATPEPAPGRNEVALCSTVSVVLLAIMCAIYLGRPNPDNLPAIWYTVVLAAPYAFIAIRCLRPQPGQFVFEFARTLSRATIIGIVFITIGGGVGFILVMLMTPNPLAYIGLVAGEIGVQMGGAGLWMLFALFAVQFVLGYCARRGEAPASPDDAAKGRLLGYAMLLLPFFIFLHINAVRAIGETRHVQKAIAERTTREEARHTAIDARSEIALQVARTTLHVCVHSGCADSLLQALKRKEVAIAFKPDQHGEYFAVVAGAAEDAPRYVTNETGILLRLKDDKSPFGDVSWNSEYILVDSTYLDLALIRGCIRDEIISEWDEYPLHLPKDVGCYLQGDTSVVPSRHGGDSASYRVVYASPRKPGTKLVKSFSLSMRPVAYGRPYVRSFLMTHDTAYVTTANRAARKSDPGLRGCEVDSYYCGGRH